MSLPAPGGLDAPVEVLDGLARQGLLFAVLDACDSPAVPFLANRLGPQRAISLYRGEPEERYWDIAPYLVRVDTEVLEWIRSVVWHEHWGIFAVTGDAREPSFEAVRTHFRRFLTVLDPDGEEMLFRFYDPRVLPLYVGSCTPPEREAFFGPLSGFLIAQAGSSALLVLDR